IFKTGITGGTFVSTLPVRPRLIFTRCSNPTGPGLPTVIADPGPTVNLSTPTTGAVWSYGPMGLAIPPSPGGMGDHDCNSATPPPGHEQRLPRGDADTALRLHHAGWNATQGAQRRAGDARQARRAARLPSAGNSLRAGRRHRRRLPVRQLRPARTRMRELLR